MMQSKQRDCNTFIGTDSVITPGLEHPWKKNSGCTAPTGNQLPPFPSVPTICWCPTDQLLPLPPSASHPLQSAVPQHARGPGEKRGWGTLEGGGRTEREVVGQRWSGGGKRRDRVWGKG